MFRTRFYVPGALLVAVAAALWGADALIRKPLSQSTAVATIVFGEHVVLVACTLPFLAGALVAMWRAGWKYVAAAVIIGAGASAVATILFTQAFVVSQGHYVTPVLLQKVQPLVAVVAARAILGERPRRHFPLFFLGGIVGAWLIAFPHPTDVSAHGARPVVYALAAAVLWALGTVLGRLLTTVISFERVTTLRFFFGLPASFVAVLILGTPSFASWHDEAFIALLALVTGLVALALYYYGLQRTPAVTASIAELAFPVSATAVSYLYFHQHLSGTQWLGMALTTLVVLLLPIRRVRIVAIEPPEAAAAAA